MKKRLSLECRFCGERLLVVEADPGFLPTGWLVTGFTAVMRIHLVSFSNVPPHPSASKALADLKDLP